MIQDTRFVNGAQRLSQRIRTIREKFQLPAFTEELGNLLLKRTLERFDREVDPDGNPWAPLADTTIQTKLRLGFGGMGKLKRTTKLRNSIRLIRGDVTGTIFTNTGAGVRIGISDEERVDVGRVHNLGTNRIPQRRFLGIGALDVKAVDSFLRRRARTIIDEA